MQEVLLSFKEQLIEKLKPDSHSYSLDYRKPGLHDGKNRKLGVLTLVFGGQIKESNVLERTVFPDPDSPIRATVPPFGISKDASRRAGVSEP